MFPYVNINNGRNAWCLHDAGTIWKRNKINSFGKDGGKLSCVYTILLQFNDGFDMWLFLFNYILSSNHNDTGVYTIPVVDYFILGHFHVIIKVHLKKTTDQGIQ